jgi:hypothetical protein
MSPSRVLLKASAEPIGGTDLNKLDCRQVEEEKINNTNIIDSVRSPKSQGCIKGASKVAGVNAKSSKRK